MSDYFWGIYNIYNLYPAGHQGSPSAMTSSHICQEWEVILMPSTEPLHKKGLKIKVSGAFVSCDSAKLQALFCHAFLWFLALVVPSRGQRFYLTKHFCCSWTVDSSLTKETGSGTWIYTFKQKGKRETDLFRRKSVRNQQVLSECGVCGMAWAGWKICLERNRSLDVTHLTLAFQARYFKSFWMTQIFLLHL